MSIKKIFKEQPDNFEFNSENLSNAKKIIKNYPDGKQQSAVMALLYIAQRQNNNWIPLVAMKYIAKLLHMSYIKVYEVATFYDMFYTEPVGRHQLRVCTNISCMLRGAGDIMELLQNKLDVEVGGMTADGRFTLFEAECLGACGGAPMLVCGDRYFEDLTEEKLDQLLAEMD